jgi:hypothetical protein
MKYGITFPFIFVAITTFTYFLNYSSEANPWFNPEQDSKKPLKTYAWGKQFNPQKEVDLYFAGPCILNCMIDHGGKQNATDTVF